MTDEQPQRTSVLDPYRSLSGRTVLVTGHTGFKGSWLSMWLDVLGARVVGLSDKLPERGAFRDLGLADRVETVLVDVRDLDGVVAAVRAAGPDVVFHLAAQPLVRASWRDRTSTIATNVLGTVHVVEAALACRSVEAIVVVTTDKVYENRGSGPAFVEADRLGGHDPYSASKAAAEIVLAPYRDAAHMGFEPRPLVAVRGGNVIGGGDWSPDRLIPDIIRALERGDPVSIRRPDAVRPWQHVLDCLWGYLLAATAMIDARPVAGAYNFAPRDDGQRSVLDVARRVVAQWGGGHDAIVVEREESSAEAGVLRLDAGLAHRDLGWAPKWDLERSIDETVRFYRAADPVALGRRQIEEHAARLTS